MYVFRKTEARDTTAEGVPIERSVSPGPRGGVSCVLVDLPLASCLAFSRLLEALEGEFYGARCRGGRALSGSIDTAAAQYEGGWRTLERPPRHRIR